MNNHDLVGSKSDNENNLSRTGRIVILKKQLKEIMTVRDEIVTQLTEMPFMEISRRLMYKEKLPYLDAKIKRLKLDIKAFGMIFKISQGDLENPKLPSDYQHYDNKKRKNQFRSSA